MRSLRILFTISILVIIHPFSFGKIELTVHTNQVIEWSYQSEKNYNNPFSDVSIEATLIKPDKSVITIPGFWAGKMMRTH